jgi:AAA ATPase domain/Protein of unknown function (DUF3696)
MLTALQLSNFKAFADTQRLPIKPLTLIFGANSAGKSSLIHGLLLAHEANRTGNLDVFRTEIGGDSVDLGGFRQYVHRRDLDRRMEWAAEIDVVKLQGRLAELLAPVQKVILTLEIGLEQVEKTTTRRVVDPKTGDTVLAKIPTGELVRVGDPFIQTYQITADGASILLMNRRADGKLYFSRLDGEHPVLRQVLKAIVETSTTAESPSMEDFKAMESVFVELFREISVPMDRFLANETEKMRRAVKLQDQHLLFPVSKGNRKEDLTAAVHFFLPRTLMELTHGLNMALAGELSRLRYLGPLRSYPPRHFSFAQSHEPNWDAGGGYAWDVVRTNSEVREAVNRWLGSADRMPTHYELVIRRWMSPDSPQAAAQLWNALEYWFNDVAIMRVDSEAEADVMRVLDQEAGEEGWAYRVKDRPPYKDEPPYEDMVKLLQSRLLDRDSLEFLDALVLVDRRSNTEVSHRDVGIGVSQVLPVLATCYASRNQIVAIEQPEIHLHPALQAELADLFIESALGDRQNTFILETHSEHLILRLLRRMRETYDKKLREDLFPITPRDVSVLFVEREGSRSIVREMPINDRGEFAKSWPGGFFEEGLREVLP